jgi:O-antigen/teichoic acid export membrane protein
MIARRITGNLVANLFGGFVNLLWQVAAIPLFLLYWTTERYGVWLVVSALPSYLALSDFGVMSVAANRVSMFVAQGEIERARQSLHTACGMLLIVLLVGCVLGTSSVLLLPWPEILNVSASSDIEIQHTLLLLGVSSLLTFFFYLFSAVYRACYAASRGIWALGLVRLLEFAVTVGCAAFSDSFVLMSAALLAAKVVAVAAMWVDSAKQSSHLRLGLRGFSVNELSQTWKPALLFMAFPLGNAIYFQGLTILAGKFFGPTAVVTFTALRTLTRGVVQITSLLKHSIMPEFSYLFGATDIVKSRRLNAIAFEITWVSTLALCCGLYFLTDLLVGVWTHYAVRAEPGIVLLLLGSAFLNSLWLVGSGMLMGTNQHSGLAVIYTGATSASLAIAGFGASTLGLHGVCWAMVCCELIVLPYTIWKTCSLNAQPVSEFLRCSLALKETTNLLRTLRTNRPDGNFS